MKITLSVFAFIVFLFLVSPNYFHEQIAYHTRLKQLKIDDRLDPMNLQFVPEYRYIDNLGIRLFQLNHRGEYVGMLAKEFSLSSEKTTLNIKLHDAYFSDGSRIRATDVIRSLKRTILYGTAHSNPRQYIKGASKTTSLNDPVEGLEEISQSELAIHLNHPTKEIFYFFQPRVSG